MTTKPTTLPPIAPATIRAVDVCARGDEDDALAVDVTRADDEVLGVDSPDHGVGPAAFEDVVCPEAVGVEVAGRGLVVVGWVIGVEEGVVGGELRQPFEDPAWMVKGAETASAPALSLRLMTTDVPAVISPSQANKVPVCSPRFWRGDESMGSAPGRMLKKYGGVPPDQVISVSSHSAAPIGVFKVSWAFPWPIKRVMTLKIIRRIIAKVVIVVT
jgi:hypothetical protein